MEKAQLDWLICHLDYCPVGPPRLGVMFKDCVTLYAYGTTEALAPMKMVRLREGCICVGGQNHFVKPNMEQRS